MLGKYQSGQMGQTVNLLAYAFGGSNPSLPTENQIVIERYCLIFCSYIGLFNGQFNPICSLRKKSALTLAFSNPFRTFAKSCFRHLHIARERMKRESGESPEQSRCCKPHPHDG